MVHTLNPSIRKAEAGGIAEDEAGLVLQCYLLTKRKQADLYQNLKTARHSEWPLMSVLTKQRQGTSLWAPGQAGAYSETPPPNKQTLCRGSADRLSGNCRGKAIECVFPAELPKHVRTNPSCETASIFKARLKDYVPFLLLKAQQLGVWNTTTDRLWIFSQESKINIQLKLWFLPK